MFCSFLWWFGLGWDVGSWNVKMIESKPDVFEFRLLKPWQISNLPCNSWDVTSGRQEQRSFFAIDSGDRVIKLQH